MLGTVTGPLLLKTLRDPDAGEARREFDERYRPVLQAFARRLGLSDQPAEQAVADTLDAFVSRLRSGEFDAAEGELRDWFLAVARQHIAAASLSAQDTLSSPEELQQVWSSEWRRAIIRHALAELYEDEAENSHVLQAFELHCLEKHNAGEVASELGMSRSAVFSAKNRLMERLRGRVEQLEDEF
jgi:DNA-directed RNA polymerase specialized sigma24 family protein